VPSFGEYSIKAGFTYQVSRYTEAQEFDETNFFRTPNAYGFLALDWDPIKDLCVSVSANYTGKMLVPYFGTTIANPEDGELRTSDDFFDLGVKISYDFKVASTGFQVYVGIKNAFNSYQNDFDYGIDRDPAYMYGPSLPRYVYFGAKMGIF
jgi:outer membrane receptor for ferrienterochelin and colicins